MIKNNVYICNKYIYIDCNIVLSDFRFMEMYLQT